MTTANASVPADLLAKMDQPRGPDTIRGILRRPDGRPTVNVRRTANPISGEACWATYVDHRTATPFGAVPEHYDTLHVEFDHDLSDDDADTVAAMLGYAWTTVGGGSSGFQIGNGLIVWTDPNVMVSHLPIALRPTGKRTTEQATHDLLNAFAGYLSAGHTPLRRDQTSLVQAGPGSQIPDLGVPWFFLGDSENP